MNCCPEDFSSLQSLEETRLRILAEVSTIVCDVEVNVDPAGKVFLLYVPRSIPGDVAGQLVTAAKTIVAVTPFHEFTVSFQVHVGEIS